MAHHVRLVEPTQGSKIASKPLPSLLSSSIPLPTRRFYLMLNHAIAYYYYLAVDKYRKGSYHHCSIGSGACTNVNAGHSYAVDKLLGCFRFSRGLDLTYTPSSRVFLFEI